MSSAVENDPWETIEKITGKIVPDWAKYGCEDPKLVTIPVGRTLYGAGPATKRTMEWGGFEENDIGWYLQGNQLDPEWYGKENHDQIELYQFSVTISQPTPAVMSKVRDQSGAPDRVGPKKFQYYNPAGLGEPVQGKSLGILKA